MKETEIEPTLSPTKWMALNRERMLQISVVEYQRISADPFSDNMVHTALTPALAAADEQIPQLQCLLTTIARLIGRIKTNASTMRHGIQ